MAQTAEEIAIEKFIKHPDSYSSFNRVTFTGKQLKAVAVEFARQHVIDLLFLIGSKYNINIGELDYLYNPIKKIK